MSEVAALQSVQNQGFFNMNSGPGPSTQTAPQGLNNANPQFMSSGMPATIPLQAQMASDSGQSWMGNGMFHTMSAGYPATAPGPAPVAGPSQVVAPPTVAQPVQKDSSSHAIPVVDLTTESASSTPQSTHTPLANGMDIDPPSTSSPFDGLGSAQLSPGRRQPSSFRVIDSLSQKLSVPHVPSNYDATSKDRTVQNDSSSISQKAPPPVIASSSSNPPAAPGPKPTLFSDITPFLTASSIQREKPGLLFKYLRLRGEDDDEPPLFKPTPTQLIEILKALDKHASQTYLGVMGDTERYADVIRRWIKACILKPALYEEAIVLLLRILARTRMPLDYIQEYKVGSLVKRLKTSAEEAGLRSLPAIIKAYNQYSNFMQQSLIPNGRKAREVDSDEEPANKKRKTDVQPEARPAAPSAKAKSATGPPRTDMSFFSGPKAETKPKPKPLPSFKKTTAPSSAPTAAPAARPAGSSLLANTMRMLKKDPSPPLSAQPPKTEAKPELKAPVKAEGGKLNRKGHKVRWVDLSPGGPPPDRPLESVRLFKQELHELEAAPWQIEGGVHDHQEGRALHHHIDEVQEEVDWYEPRPYEITGDLPAREDPTPEAAAQEERERGILAVSYPAGQAPMFPDDIDVRQVQADDNTKQMNPNPMYHHAAGMGVPQQPAQAAPTPAATVTDLLRNLTSLPGVASSAQPQQQQQQQYGASYDYHQGSSSQYSAPRNNGYGYQQPQQQNQPGFTPNRWGGSAQRDTYGGGRPANRGSWGGAHRGGGAAGGAGFNRPCRYYNQPGGCFSGANCPFQH